MPPTKKEMTTLQVNQRKMERKIGNIIRRDRITKGNIRGRAKLKNAANTATKSMWNWGGHKLRMDPKKRTLSNRVGTPDRKEEYRKANDTIT